MITQDRASARFLMCAPEHFAVSYAINPWMDPQSWARDERAHAADEEDRHRRRHAALLGIELGHAIDHVTGALDAALE